jgi:hypothetical protein
MFLLEQYYQLCDSDDREPLVRAYHPDAMFQSHQPALCGHVTVLLPLLSKLLVEGHAISDSFKIWCLMFVRRKTVLLGLFLKCGQHVCGIVIVPGCNYT